MDQRVQIDFSDAKQCLALVAGLPLTKLAHVRARLEQLLDGVRATPPAAESYLEVLETMRPAVALVQEEAATRYAASALPPSGPGEEVLAQVFRLWQGMARAYTQVDELATGGPEELGRRALLAQRRIHYAGRAIIEFFRARREVPERAWLAVNALYGAAEASAIAAVPVAEPLLGQAGRQSCAQAYAALLLVALGNPYGRGSRDFACLVRWSELFAPYVDLTPGDGRLSSRGFAVDLARDAGPLPAATLGGRAPLHEIATSRLQHEMHRAAAALKAGSAPAVAGLNEDCAAADASRLLTGLYRAWCSAATPRRFQRRHAQGEARVCYGFEAIHYHVAGREFVQPAHARAYSRAEVDEIFTFRHQLDPSQTLQLRAAQARYTVETWALADHSVAGFRMLRLGAGVRVEHAQLIGLLPDDGEHYLLCRVSWLMYYASGALMLGAYVLPGLPEAVAARRTGLGRGEAERYARAFLLPAMPSLNEAETLVLPKGWFAPARTVEVAAGERAEVRLTAMKTEGADFDRVSFERLRRPPHA
jgi:hypothetical protein